VRVATSVAELPFPRGLAHLKDHLTRAADNTVLRLSEASGRTLGNRRQHLQAAYAENQEVQSDLLLLRSRGIPVAIAVVDQGQTASVGSSTGCCGQKSRADRAAFPNECRL